MQFFVNLQSPFAAVVELVDTHVSGACVRKDMRVRVSPAAHLSIDQILPVIHQVMDALIKPALIKFWLC